MARRKKVNPRILIILGVLAALMLLGGGVYIYKQLPKDPEPFFLQAEKDMEAKEYRQAVANYGRGIHHQIKAKINDAQRVYEWAMAEYSHATLTPDLEQLQREQYYQNAFRDLLQALVIDPEHLDARRQLVLMRLSTLRPSHPKLLENAGLFVTEVTSLIDLLEDGEERAELYFQRGQAKRVLIGQEDPQDTIDSILADLDEALRLAPTNQAYWLEGKVSLLVELEEDELAEQTLLEGIEVLPECAELYVSYANLLNKAERRTEALEQIATAVKVDPNSAVGYLAQAHYFLLEGQLEDAMASLAQAEAVDPTHLQIYRYRALVLQRLEKWVEASDSLRQGQVVTGELLAKATDPEYDVDKDDPEYLDAELLTEAKITLHFDLAGNLLEELRKMPEQTEEEQAARIEEAKQQLVGVAEVQQKPEQRPRYLKLQGRIALAENRRGEALAYLEEAEKVYTNANIFDLQTADLLIGLYLQNRLVGKAEDIVDKLADRGMADMPAVLTLQARISMHYHELDEAERYLRRALAVDPENPEAIELMKLVRVQQGRIDTVTDDETPSITMIAYLMENADAKWQEGEKQEALNAMRDLYARVPDNPAVMRKLMSIYLEVGDEASAQAILREAILRDPENQNLKDELHILSLSDDDARLKARLELAQAIEDPYQRASATAGTYLLAGKMPEYLEWLEKAVNLSEPKSASRMRLNERLLNVALQEKNWDVADRSVALATEEDMDAVGGRIFKAKTALFRENVDEAIRLLLTVLEEKPRSRASRMLLGVCYMTKQQPRLAIEQYEYVYDDDRGYEPVVIEMVRATKALGDREQWRVWVERAHQQAPYDSFVQSEWLEMKEDEGNPRELIEARRKMLQSNPNNVSNLLRLGALYERIKEYDEAERMYRRVLDISPKRLAAAAALLGFYDRIDRTTGMQGVIAELLELAEDNEETVKVYLLYGELLRNRNPELALVTLDEAIKLDPSPSRGWLAKANTYAALGRWEEAADAQAKVAALLPDDEDHLL